MEPRPEIVVIGAAAGVRSPVSGEEGAFVVVELWAGDEPGGVLRRVESRVLGDIVELVPVQGGAPRTVVVRRVRVRTRGVPRLAPLVGEGSLAPELVSLLAGASARGAHALAVGERVFRQGDRFLAVPSTATEPLVLEELDRDDPEAPRHDR